MKQGKVVLILSGKYAGRKAVVLKNYDDASKDHPFAHAFVAGIDKYPLKITRAMSKKKQATRMKIRPFVKVYNYNHLLPTRYSVDIGWEKNIVNKDCLKDPSKKKKARREVKAKFEERYKPGKNKWFFTKLRF